MRSLLHQPLVLSLLCFPFCVLLLGRWQPKDDAVARWLWKITVLFLMVGITGPILSAGRHMIYHDEPSLIAVAAAELHGQPLYHAANAGDRYALLYGPFAYWVYMPPMFGHAVDLRIFQLWVMLPLFISGLLTFRLARRAGDLFGCGLALLPYAVTVIMQSANEWAMKGDAWMLLFFSLGLEMALILPTNAAVIVVAVCASLLINIKITALFLACVPLTLLGGRLGVRKASYACLLAIVFTVMPFMVPGVSAANFIYWLRASSRHGIDLSLVASNLELVVFMALPAIFLLSFLLLKDRTQTRLWLRGRSWVVVLSIVACFTAIVTGGKVGAGSWHCAPLAPMFAWFTATLWRRWRTLPSFFTLQPIPRALVATVVVSQVLVGSLFLRASLLLHWKGDIPYSSTIPAHLIEQDLVSIVRTYPGTQIQMGYGNNETYEWTWQRPTLVLLGNRYFLDADALNETDFAHLPLPQAALGELRSCRSQIFLIPKDNVPFSMQSLYYLAGAAAPRDLFPDAFRQEFLRDYRKSGSSRYFDLWSCRD
jgi:hypothetical protein